MHGVSYLFLCEVEVESHRHFNFRHSRTSDLVGPFPSSSPDSWRCDDEEMAAVRRCGSGSSTQTFREALHRQHRSVYVPCRYALLSLAPTYLSHILQRLATVPHNSEHRHSSGFTNTHALSLHRAPQAFTTFPPDLSLPCRFYMPLPTSIHPDYRNDVGDESECNLKRVDTIVELCGGSFDATYVRSCTAAGACTLMNTILFSWPHSTNAFARTFTLSFVAHSLHSSQL